MINRSLVKSETQNFSQRLIFQKYSKKHDYRSVIYSSYRESPEEGIEELKTDLAKNPIEKDDTFATEFLELCEPLSEEFLSGIIDRELKVIEKPEPENVKKEAIEKLKKKSGPAEKDNSLFFFLVLMLLALAGAYIVKSKFSAD